MAFMVVSQKVEDYAKWRAVFVEHASIRRQMGCKGGKVLHVGGTPCRVVIMLEWEDVDRARKFSELPFLTDGMKAAGVIGTPECWYFESVELAIS